MSIYSLKRVQNIPTTLDKAWDFFSNAANLYQITPPDYRIQVISLYHGDYVYAGQLIEYRITILPAVRVYWMTEITHAVQGRYFVDEQRRGPYRLWHHQHHFREIPGGVEMTDIVHYQLPLGPLGDMTRHLLVKGKLEKMFDYRQEKTKNIFGSFPV